MKNIIKKISFVALFAVMALFSNATDTFASTSFNTHANDCKPWLSVGNYSTGSGIGSTCWPLSSVSAQGGDTVNVKVYIHNSGNEDAKNVRVFLTPKNTNEANTHVFSARITADNASTLYQTVYVQTTTKEKLSYDGAVIYIMSDKETFPYGQSGSEAFTSDGLRLGNIPYTGPEQGVILFAFDVSDNGDDNNNEYECNDGVDNDDDGYTDSNDDGCSGSNDDSEDSDGNNDSDSYFDIDTLDAEYITTNSAFLTAEYDADEDTEVFFEYGTSRGSLNNESEEKDVDDATNEEVTIAIENLDDNETYYFRAVIRDEDGNLVRSDNILSFTTEEESSNNDLQVTTLDADDVTEDSATLRASFIGDDEDVEVWFAYGTSRYDLDETTEREEFTQEEDNVRIEIDGLEEGETYYYQAIARYTNGSDIASNGIHSFTTNGNDDDNDDDNNNNDPEIETNSATSIDEDSAVLRAEYDGNGRSSRVWFEYGTSTSMTEETSEYSVGSSDGDFSRTITGLRDDTLYYFRAVIENSNGTEYGDRLTFRTDDEGSVVYPVDPVNYDEATFTILATSIGANSAQLNGVARDDRSLDSKNAWFEYGTTSNLGQTVTPFSIATREISSFDRIITGLTPSTRYYFRAVTRDDNGEVRYGSVLSFTTQRVGSVTPPPTVVGDIVTLTIENQNNDICREDSIDYILSYENKTARTINNTVLRVVFPEEIEFDQSSRGNFAEKERTLLVTVGALKPNESGTIFVEGFVSGESDDETFLTSSAVSYTNPVSGIDEEVSTYVFSNIDEDCQNGRNLTAASIFGNGDFLPDTLIEWMITILVIFGLVFVGRKLYIAR